MHLLSLLSIVLFPWQSSNNLFLYFLKLSKVRILSEWMEIPVEWRQPRSLNSLKAFGWKAQLSVLASLQSGAEWTALIVKVHVVFFLFPDTDVNINDFERLIFFWVLFCWVTVLCFLPFFSFPLSSVPPVIHSKDGMSLWQFWNKSFAVLTLARAFQGWAVLQTIFRVVTCLLLSLG